MIIAILLLFIFAVSLIYYYNHTIVNDGAIAALNSSRYAYQIERAELNNGILELSGFCFDVNSDLSTPDNAPGMRVILVNTADDKKRHYYRVENALERPEVNEYYHGDSEYLFCGFEANINLRGIDIDQTSYEIVLQPDMGSSITIRDHLFISHGQLADTYPNSFRLPDIEGTDLDSIVSEGTLRGCHPDIGVYIYQYEWKLYYIAENQYPFESGWDKIACNIGTNRNSLLEEDRQQHGFVTNAFCFFDNEITNEISTGNYRVAALDLPLEYPVTYVCTGYWTSSDEWIWEDKFCPGLP